MTKISALEASLPVKEYCALRENQRIVTKLTRDLPRPVPRQMNSVQVLPSYLFNNQSDFEVILTVHRH